MPRPFVLLLWGVLLVFESRAYAAGIIARVGQMKSHKQQPTQEEYQLYQQQQQALAESQPATPVAPPLSYEQTVEKRNQALAEAIAHARQPGAYAQRSSVNTHGQEPQDTLNVVVDLADVWKKLDSRSTAWTLFVEDQAKILTVSEYIDRWHKQGALIKQTPAHYATMIDQIVTQNPQMLQRPFGELVQIVAIIEYDFDNGINKDDLAKKVLGEEGYLANKKRFTQQ